MNGKVPLPHIFLGALLGVAGGFYIYKPIFEQYRREQNNLKEKLQATELEEKKE
ncbi:protein PIGBOS1 [Mauremys mutica]|uniref:protein PIGBOS1 n=1 Tax=Mauremys mutica TaxID=74926 RepID=UPI001D154B2F|nr:protein PIGBOS1 [Mauremys mutica]XP_044835470.1 protein PIGBOS1 [Mauremys mutica]XP_044835472.1 protein PIGBOS1 [Mauremys mutica]XP_044835473.1 protein PIGBOS1 [Mauremys mutica]